MKTVTVWKRLNKGVGEVGRFEHNHISDGYDPASKQPTGKFKEQHDSWQKGIWVGIEAQLIDGVVHLVGADVDGEWQVARINPEAPDNSGELLRID